VRWIVACLGIAFAVPVLAQSPGELDETSLAPGLAMWAGRGGNIGVLHGPEGTLLIDDQFADVTPAIRKAVARLGAEPIRFVLNTHFHGDHVGGNENLAGQGALIVAHENVRERMSAEQWNGLTGKSTPPSPKAALPVVTFDEGIRFHFNGHSVEVLHVAPAHTDGDSIVFFREANVLHLGDVYFNGLYPYIDVEGGGSVDGVIAAADRALALANDETQIIPGHGPLSNASELRVYRNMLQSVRDRVAAGIARGETLDQITASAPTRDFDEAWGGGFLKPHMFVRIVHSSLTAR
jgi:cyclase